MYKQLTHTHINGAKETHCLWQSHWWCGVYLRSYKQQKFNLFREESEGYSKLVSELGHERRPVEAVPAILDNIRSLIGVDPLSPLSFFTLSSLT